jgi:Flp pilus assembly protein TadG
MNRSDQRRDPRWRNGGRAQRGAGALEFAMAAPILLGLLLATVDLGRYLVSAQLVAAASTAVADLASQTEDFTPEMDPEAVSTGRELAVLANAAHEVARPVDLTTDGAIIVTVMTNSGSGAEVLWQRRWGRADIASTVGAGNTRGVAIAAGDSVVFAEVAGIYRPWLLSGRLLGLGETVGYRSVSVRRARLGGPSLAQ